jgi:hypothetical protein
LISTIIEYIIVTFAVSIGVEDSATITLPQINFTISLFYHVLPASVLIALTVSFTHLTTHIATLPRRFQKSKKAPPRKTHRRLADGHLKAIRQFYRKLRRATRKTKRKIVNVRVFAYVEHRIVLARAIILGAVTILAVFSIMVLLLTVAANPKLVPTSTTNFYEWNTTFLNFVAATIRTSEGIAATISPIGAIATPIHNALIGISPTFRNILEAAASSLTKDLVSLKPNEKYLLTQNAAAWTITLMSLLYTRYVKTQTYRR